MRLFQSETFCVFKTHTNTKEKILSHFENLYRNIFSKGSCLWNKTVRISKHLLMLYKEYKIILIRNIFKLLKYTFFFCHFENFSISENLLVRVESISMLPQNFSSGVFACDIK